MTDDLPEKFDVIIVGTGMPESILAAAFSRIGCSVLHIDRNDYYSGQWASFNLDGIERWQKQVAGEGSLQCPSVDLSTVLRDGERVEPLRLVDDSYTDVISRFYVVDEDLDDTAVQAEEDKVKIPTNIDRNEEQEITENSSRKEENNSTADEVVEEKTVEDLNKEKESQTFPSSDNSEEVGNEQNNEKTEKVNQSKESDMNSEVNTNQLKKDNSGLNDENTNTVNKGNDERISYKEEHCKRWNQKTVKKEWRKFNLDLAPRLLYCGGKMVELLITSDIAKYCEFKTVTRMLTVLNGKLEKVPCSRADVFSSRDISMLDKRMLMKFLTFCAEYDKHPEDYQGFMEVPFLDYLKHKKLSPNVCQFVQHAIAMVNDKATTQEGLKKTQKFLLSLGRYGNTAFLWPLYGSGEMPQSFCRMSAVFGGTYCLRMSASSLIVDSDNKCTGVINTEGKRIDCKHLILEHSYTPEKYLSTSQKRTLCRGILLIDKSILPNPDENQLSLLQLLDPDTPDHPISVLELPHSSMACPNGLYVLHLTKEVMDSDADSEDLLSHAVRLLCKNHEDPEDDKPTVIWSLYFKQSFINHPFTCNMKPDNVAVVSGPGTERDMDHTVLEAREIFERLMPGEEFLPRPPNPEDIIYVDEEETTANQDSNNQSDFSSNVTDHSQSKTNHSNVQSDSGEVESGYSVSESGNNQSESGNNLSESGNNVSESGNNQSESGNNQSDSSNAQLEISNSGTAVESLTSNPTLNQGAKTEE